MPFRKAVMTAAVLAAALTPAARAAEDRVLFDFESGTYEGWTVEGEAFGTSPLHAAKVATAWREDRRPHGWQGAYMAHVGDERHVLSKPGRLLSRPFVIDRPFLRFRLGGENNPGVFVRLLVGGEPVRTAYGNNSYDLRERGWEVRDLRGRTARIEIGVDSPVHVLLRADHFTLSDAPPPPVWHPAQGSAQESKTIRVGEYAPAYMPEGAGTVTYAGLVHGHDKRWHLYGIERPSRTAAEGRLFHATAPRITGPFTLAQRETLRPEPAAGEQFLDDPFVLFHDGTYYLFYVGAGERWKGWDKESQGPYSVYLATSKDGANWTRCAGGPLFTDNPFALTPYVHRVDGRWVMYYAGAEPPDVATGAHAILARESDDLVHWRTRRTVLSNPGYPPWPEHAFVHSPVVFRRGDLWYMLAGPATQNNQSRFHYRMVFRSQDPQHWEQGSADGGLFAEGGAKVYRDEKGDWFVAHAGGYFRGLWVAPLKFADGQDGKWASIPPAGGPPPAAPPPMRPVSHPASRAVAAPPPLETAPDPLPHNRPIRIDVGASADWTDPDGNRWLADTGFTGGTAADRGAVVKITGTDRPHLYRTERTGMRAYRFSAANGRYAVRMHFCENGGAIYGRSFGMTVGATEFPFVQVSPRVEQPFVNLAQVKTFVADVTDGFLTIRFRPRMAAPQLSALEIVPIDVTAPVGRGEGARD